MHLRSLVAIKQLTLSRTFWISRSFTNWGALENFDCPPTILASLVGRGGVGCVNGVGVVNGFVIFEPPNKEDEKIPRGGTSGTVSDGGGRFLFEGSCSPKRL